MYRIFRPEATVIKAAGPPRWVVAGSGFRRPFHPGCSGKYMKNDHAPPHSQNPIVNLGEAYIRVANSSLTVSLNNVGAVACNG